jgi:hypothetical protein
MTSGWMQKWCALPFFLASAPDVAGLDVRHEEVCLLEQRYLMDDTMAVKVRVTLQRRSLAI